MFDISPIQIIIVLAIALLIFGPKRLPEMGRSIGRGIRDFKDGLTNDNHDDEVPDDPATRTALVAESADEPTIEDIVKDNVTPEPAHQDAAPLAGSRS